MFLEKLSVRNLRSVVEADIDFADTDRDRRNRKWSLLVGENGTGKSTLLKAIGLILAGSDALPFLLGQSPGTWVRQGQARAEIRARVRTADWEPRDLQLVIDADASPRQVIGGNEEGLRPLDAAIDRAAQNYITVGYGPYRRVGVEPQFGRDADSRPPRAASLLTLFDRHAVVNPLSAWAVSLDYEMGEEGLSIVRDALDRLLPGILFETIERSTRTLLFRTADGLVPLEELSDGYQNVAVWIGDLLYRIQNAFAHRENPLGQRGLLLIDEVDAHLHPAWQRRLRQFLDDKLPNIQIVATTHSALTLQQAHEGETMVLRRGPDGAVRASPLTVDPSKMRLHQLYDLAFGIDSLDSWEIEQAKNVYRALKGRPAEQLAPDEQRRLVEAEATLEALPDDRGDAPGNPALASYFDQLDALTAAIARPSES